MDSERSYLALPSEDSQKLSPAFLKSKLHSLIGVSARWKKEKEEGKGEPSPSRVEGEGRAGGEQEWKDRLRKWSVAKARAEVLLLFKNLHIRAGGQSQLLGLSPDKAETVKVETRVDRDMEKADSEVVETEPETRFVYNSAVIALAVYLCVGVAMYSLVGGFLVGSTTNNFIDALYFCIVTITSVGYGDLSPQTVPAKVFTCFFVFAGFGLLNILLSEAAEYLVRKQESTVMDYLEIGRKAQHRSDHALLQMEESIFKRIETSRRKSWKRVLVAGGAVLLALLVGAGVLHYGEGLAPLDALYCACVTVTTVGYGDESFTTLGGRAFAIMWILSSTLLVAHFALCITELRVAEQQQELAADVLSRALTREELTAADLDLDGKVSLAEFVLFKLKEMKKVEDDDIVWICNEFSKFDEDKDGHLNCN